MKGSGLVLGGMIGGCIGLILSGVWFVAGVIAGIGLDQKLDNMGKHGEELQ